MIRAPSGRNGGNGFRVRLKPDTPPRSPYVLQRLGFALILAALILAACAAVILATGG